MQQGKCYPCNKPSVMTSEEYIQQTKCQEESIQQAKRYPTHAINLVSWLMRNIYIQQAKCQNECMHTISLMLLMQQTKCQEEYLQQLNCYWCSKLKCQVDYIQQAKYYSCNKTYLFLLPSWISPPFFWTHKNLNSLSSLFLKGHLSSSLISHNPLSFLWILSAFPLCARFSQITWHLKHASLLQLLQLMKFLYDSINT